MVEPKEFSLPQDEIPLTKPDQNESTGVLLYTNNRFGNGVLVHVGDDVALLTNNHIIAGAKQVSFAMIEGSGARE